MLHNLHASKIPETLLTGGDQARLRSQRPCAHLRLGIAVVPFSSQRLSKAFIGLPSIKTSLAKEDAQQFTMELNKLLDGEAPSHHLGWPLFLQHRIATKLSALTSRSAWWAVFDDTLCVCSTLLDLPCKWQLDGSQEPVFHHQAMLNSCPWWYNFAKKVLLGP